MHIIIVEDNEVLATSISRVLLKEGYTTTLFDNGRKASVWLIDNRASYDLVMLDVRLPDMDGFEVCKKLREAQSRVPILMLTSKGALEDTVTGLNCGADDYLKKPFEFDELLARIAALLRRLPTLLEAHVVLTPDITVDVHAQKVENQGQEVHLTAKEFAVLSYFIAHPQKLITQQELYDHVFDFAQVQLSNTIEVHIKNLRKKLRTEFELPMVTIRNAGYRLDI
jgi:DNA-binding response OmpR family regulator